MRAPSRLGIAISVIGSLFGLYIAGYTGVLVAVTHEAGEQVRVGGSTVRCAAGTLRDSRLTMHRWILGVER